MLKHPRENWLLEGIPKKGSEWVLFSQEPLPWLPLDLSEHAQTSFPMQLRDYERQT